VTATEAPKRVRRRRWPWIAGGVFGTILLLVGSLLMLLATAADRAIIVRKALAIANGQLAGRIELQRAWLFPNGHFYARDVTIHGPDGAVIIRAATVETHVDLAALASKRLHLTGTTVGGAALFLVIDAQGNVNVVDAFSPKHASAPAPSKPADASAGFGFTMDIDGADVAVDEAHLVLDAPAGAVGPPTVLPTVLADLRQIAVHASVALDKAGVLTVNAPSLRADALAPLAGPLQLAATVRLKGVDLQVGTDATLDDAHLKAKAELNVATLNGLATVTDSSVGPRLLSRWLPDLEPRGVRCSASVTLQAKTLKLVSLQAGPLHGEGELTGSAQLDLTKGAAEAHLVAKGLDARALFDRLPTSSLGFALAASGERVLERDRRLAAHLAFTQSLIQGQQVGPGVLDAQFAADTLTLAGVDIAFPGGRVQGSGTISGQHVSASARIEAPDLGSLRAALGGICGVNLPHFAGRLSSQVEIEGPLASPALRAEVHAPHITLNGIEADELEAHLDAARLSSQMDLQGHVAIAELDVADHALHGVGVSVAWTTPDLHLEVQAQERGKALDLVADLLLPRDLESATVSSLELHAAGSDWLMSEPATLDFRNGVVLDHLELRADPQRLLVSLAVAPHALSGTVELEALDLAQLSATLLPSLHLSGKIDGLARYEETAGRRRGSADLTLAQVAFRGLEIPAGHLKAALADKRVTVNLLAKLGHGDVTLTGAGPIPSLPGGIEADLEATGIVLDDFDGLLPTLVGTHAALSLKLHVGGDWAAPEVALTAAAVGVTGAWTQDPQAGVLAAPLALNLQATLDSKGLKQELRAQAGQTLLLMLSGTAPIPSRKLAEAFEAPAKLAAELLAASFDERLTLTDLPLEPVIHRLPWARAPNLQGAVSAKGQFHGPLRAPRGELTLTARQLLVEHHPLGELALQLSADDKGFNGQVELHPSRGQLTAKLEWQLAPEQLRDKRKRLAARLTADLALSGLPLSIALGEQSALQGLAELSGSFRGSLAEPSARATVSLHELQLQKVAVGSLDGKASWNGTHLLATLEGQQPKGGHLDGRADLPLRLGGEPSTQPLTATLLAKGFDLAAFGALAARGGLGSTLRALAGRLDSDLKLTGTWAAPIPSGTLALSGGKLALAGFGQFTDLEAEFGVEASGVRLKKVAGKSAGGTFLIQGTALHGAAPGLAVQAHIGTERLGVYASDQLVGLLSSSEDLTGSIGREGTDLALAVHRALFSLPTLVPKSIGPTSLDPDIVVGRRPPAAAVNAKAYPFRLSVVAPDGLEVKATDLDIKARADLVLAIEGALEMKGGVFATSGVVNAYGRRFKLDRANVTFGQGRAFGPANNPYIDAQATQTIGHYRLFIDVSGHPAHLVVVSSSEPPLDKEKVGQLLVTGSADGIGSGTIATQGGSLAAASAVGGLVSEKLRNWLGPYMPLDVLTVDPNHLEAGKHITPNLYVGVIENLGVTDPRINGAEVHANYKLTDHWALDSNYGTAQAGSLDLQWTRSW
jgi:autotransporter translocation and assembly factor TamB